jgi:hypothetical protein
MGWYHHDCFVRTAYYIFDLLQIGGMEIDLPRLYQTVQSLGGLKEVIEKKKWPKVSDAMKIPKLAQDRVTKLDDIYCKYLLPYDTLSPGERNTDFLIMNGWRQSVDFQLKEKNYLTRWKPNGPSVSRNLF